MKYVYKKSDERAQQRARATQTPGQAAAPGPADELENILEEYRAKAEAARAAAVEAREKADALKAAQAQQAPPVQTDENDGLPEDESALECAAPEAVFEPDAAFSGESTARSMEESAPVHPAMPAPILAPLLDDIDSQPAQGRAAMWDDLDGGPEDAEAIGPVPPVEDDIAEELETQAKCGAELEEPAEEPSAEPGITRGVEVLSREVLGILEEAAFEARLAAGKAEPAAGNPPHGAVAPSLEVWRILEEVNAEARAAAGKLARQGDVLARGAGVLSPEILSILEEAAGAKAASQEPSDAAVNVAEEGGEPAVAEDEPLPAEADTDETQEELPDEPEAAKSTPFSAGIVAQADEEVPPAESEQEAEHEPLCEEPAVAEDEPLPAEPGVDETQEELSDEPEAAQDAPFDESTLALATEEMPPEEGKQGAEHLTLSEEPAVADAEPLPAEPGTTETLEVPPDQPEAAQGALSDESIAAQAAEEPSAEAADLPREPDADGQPDESECPPSVAEDSGEAFPETQAVPEADAAAGSTLPVAEAHVPEAAAPRAEADAETQAGVECAPADESTTLDETTRSSAAESTPPEDSAPIKNAPPAAPRIKFGSALWREHGKRAVLRNFPKTAAALSTAAVLALCLFSGFAGQNYLIVTDTNGLRQEFLTVNDTEAEALDFAASLAGPFDVLTYRRLAPRRAEIKIARAFPVALRADGQTHFIKTTSGSVGDLLARCGVELAGEDFVEPAADTPLENGTYAAVYRVTYEDETSRTEVDEQDVAEYKKDYEAKHPDEEFKESNAGLYDATLRHRLVDGVVESTEVLSLTRVIVPRPANSYAFTPGIPQSRIVGYDDIEMDEDGFPVNYTRVWQGAVCTAYSSSGGRGSSGLGLYCGTAAVNPNVIPYGTRMFITDASGYYVYGFCIATDTGTAMMEGYVDIDLYFEDNAECYAFGKRAMNVYFFD